MAVFQDGLLAGAIESRRDPFVSMGDHDEEGVIPEKGRDTLLLIDSTGKASPGWPIVLPGVETCNQLLAADNATVRVICSLTLPPGGSFDAVHRAFAFDANAEALPGWPVDIKDGSIGRVDGDDLDVLVNPLLQEGGEAGQQWPVSVAVIGKDGTLRKGADVPFPCCDSDWVIGSDGIAWRDPSRLGDREHDQDRCHGLRARRSAPGLAGDDRRQRIELRLRCQRAGLCGGRRAHGNTTRTMVSIETATNFRVARPTRPSSRPALRGAGGATFPARRSSPTTDAYIVSTADSRTTVVGLDPSGKPLAGWPYRSKLDMQWTGYCGGGDTGCG
jgi:hypothetical protein